MSADNYLRVRKFGGKYYVGMEFASDQKQTNGPPRENEKAFSDPMAAILGAFARSEMEYLEYGVQVDAEVRLDADARAREKIEDEELTRSRA